MEINKNMKQASRVESLEYAIRDVSAEARKLVAQGKDLIWLNIGDPNKYDFSTPQNIVDVFIKSAQENIRRISRSAVFIDTDPRIEINVAHELAGHTEM